MIKTIPKTGKDGKIYQSVAAIHFVDPTEVPPLPTIIESDCLRFMTCFNVIYSTNDKTISIKPGR